MILNLFNKVRTPTTTGITAAIADNRRSSEDSYCVFFPCIVCSICRRNCAFFRFQRIPLWCEHNQSPMCTHATLLQSLACTLLRLLLQAVCSRWNKEHSSEFFLPLSLCILVVEQTSLPVGTQALAMELGVHNAFLHEYGHTKRAWGADDYSRYLCFPIPWLQSSRTVVCSAFFNLFHSSILKFTCQAPPRCQERGWYLMGKVEKHHELPLANSLPGAPSSCDRKSNNLRVILYVVWVAKCIFYVSYARNYPVVKTRRFRAWRKSSIGIYSQKDLKPHCFPTLFHSKTQS